MIIITDIEEVYQAIKFNNIEIVKAWLELVKSKLLDNTTTVDQVKKQLKYFVTYATAWQRTSIVELLIDNGANPNDISHNMCYYYAGFNNNYGIPNNELKLLLTNPELYKLKQSKNKDNNCNE